MFGRKSRAQLEAEAVEARRELDAARRPGWRRALSWGGRHWFLTLVAAVVAAPVLVVGVALWGARAVVRAWWAWPGPLTTLVGGPVAGWVWHAGVGPWWAPTPVVPLAVLAGILHGRRRPAAPVVVVPDEAVAVWRTQVADGPDAPAPGSAVADATDPVARPGGHVWDAPVGRVLHVTGADSTQHVAFFRSIVPRLAAIYGVDPAAITIRTVGHNRRCAIELLDQAFVDERDAARRARILDVKPWAGPTLLDDGRFRVMTVADDGRPGHGQLWVPGQGARPIDVSGLQGTGKSNAVHVVNASILSRGLVVLDLVDLKGGASLPAWRQHGYRFTTTLKGALLALLRLCVVIDARTGQLARMPVLDADGRPVLLASGAPAVGLEFLDPSGAWPVYVTEVDEFPQVARNPVAARLVKRALERGRAVCATLALVHQGTAQADGYGDDALTRGLATNGTVVALRNDTQSTARVARGSGVDLASLGKATPGEAVLSSPCEPVAVHGRVEYLPDPWAAAARCRPGVLEEETEEAVAVLEGAVDRWGVERVAGLYLADPDGWVQAVARLDAASAVVGPVVSGPVGMLPAQPAAPLTYPDLTDAERRVWDLFAGRGPGVAVRTGEAMTGAGVVSSTFHGISRKFVSAGVLVDLGRGQWAATAALMDGSRV